MAPRALLLSPDDQAVSAITSVLEEMSVDCERPLDGASAAQKLNSQIFDLVLVDCDNLPAAKLIFDVCRRAHAGVSIPIAIVDGRAGLPTAFRLGAELILTKPVAKDQARTTIRTAVSRLKKEEPARAAKPAEPVAAAVVTEPIVNENRALAASAGASASAAKPAEAPVSSPPATPSPIITPTSIAPTGVNTPAENEALWGAPAAIAKTAKPAPVAGRAPSDDPVLAELEKAEEGPEKPIFAAYEESRKSGGHGILIAILLLAILGGGSYIAWMYLPQFRELVQPYLAQANSLIGNNGPAKGPGSPRVAPAAVPASKAPATASANTALNAAPVVIADKPAAQASTNSAAVSQPATQTDTESKTATTTPSMADKAADSQNKIAVSTSEKAAAPETQETIILSSKGAEKRLIHQVPPVYPAGLRAQKIEGTVVLKTFVNAAGTVESVQLVEGNPALSESAIAAVKQWRYRPYLHEGKIQAFQTIVLVDFQ